MKLHDRATKGEILTPAERSQLDNWYAAQDAAESELLQPVNATENSRLRAQIDIALAQLTATTQRIQQVTADNAILRNEIVLLRQQLASTQSA